MHSEKQESVRKVVEATVDEVLGQEIKKIVTLSQDTDAARKVAQAMWPDLKVEDLILLDQGDQGFLEKSAYVPRDILEVTQALVEAAAPPKLQAEGANNRYTRGKDLKKIIKSAVERRERRVRDAAERYFEKVGKDRFVNPAHVRELVIQELFRRLFAELQALGNAPDEDGPKRRLKALTALTIPGGTPDQRAERLRQIRDGKTASFPYVLKYLPSDKVPVQPTFPSKVPVTLDGFAPSVEPLVPESPLVKEALERYLRHDGVLSPFLRVLGPVDPANAEAFGRLPAFVPRERGGVLAPKGTQLELNREERYRLPDGIVCAVGTTIALESLLRHAQRALGLPGSTNARGRELVRVLAPVVPLAATTQDFLAVVFGSEQMALRDAVSHGAFVANEEAGVQEILGGLTHTLDLLVHDLNRSSLAATIFAGLHPSSGKMLDPAHEATFQAQHAGNLKLFKHDDIERLRKHCFRVLARLTPDKSLLGRSAVLIWADLDTTDKTPKLDQQPAAEFVGIIGGLIALEELFRAVHEAYGHRVLKVTKDPNTDLLRCELSILDVAAGRLLDPARLANILPAHWPESEFQESIAATLALRNAVLHGEWASLASPKVCYLHLIVKLLLTLCASVTLTPTADAS